MTLKRFFVKQLRTGMAVLLPVVSLDLVGIPGVLTIVKFFMILTLGLCTDIGLEVSIDMFSAQNGLPCQTCIYIKDWEPGLAFCGSFFRNFYRAVLTSTRANCVF